MASHIRVFEHVFGREFMEGLGIGVQTQDMKSAPLILAVSNHLPLVIGRTKESFNKKSVKFDHSDGRIGCVSVSWDTLSNRFPSYDSHEVIGVSRFGTVRANCGVFKGKWQYEVVLLSSGVMQIGWAAFNSKFRSGQGVGDTPYSYAYDGSRVCKWNVLAEVYGETWEEHDVIGCCVDLDEGNVEFFRNGRSMGVAYQEIPLGIGLVYFPAVSLQQNEGLVANFGSTPFHYQIPTYQPLQESPQEELSSISYLLGCLSKLLPLTDSRAVVSNPSKDGLTASNEAVLLEVGNILVSNIIPLLSNPYIIDSKFISFIRGLYDPEIVDHNQLRPSARIGVSRGTQACSSNNRMLNTCLDLFWMFSEKTYLKEWTSVLVSRLSSKFQYPARPQISEVSRQKDVIVVLLSFMRHKNFRYYLLTQVLFDGIKARLPWFMKLEVPVPETITFWKNGPPLEMYKRTYISAVSHIILAFQSLEELQVDLILTMMDNTDGSETEPPSRMVFLEKLRKLRMEFYALCRVDPVKRSSNSLSLVRPLFLRLFLAFEVLWEKEMDSAEPLTVPCTKFFDGSILYYDIDRLGGVLLYLLKTYYNDAEQQLGSTQPSLPISQRTDGAESFAIPSTSAVRNITESGELGNFQYRIFHTLDTWDIPSSSSANNTDRFPSNISGSVNAEDFFIEILDSLVFFYYVFSKTDSLTQQIDSNSNKIKDFVKLIGETEDSIKAVNISSSLKQQSEILKTLKLYHNYLLNHLEKCTASHAVLEACRYGRRHILLFKAILNTMKVSSDDVNLFNFVPEFYLDALVSILKDLESEGSATLFPVEENPDIKYIQMEIVKFFCDHIDDQRIRISKAKDTLLLALLEIVISPNLLEVLHQTPHESRLKLIRFLLRPYENRAWANSNWILVRIWYGSPGCFACGDHCSTYHRNELRPKPLSHPIDPLRFKNPSPSLVLLEQIQSLLKNEPDVASAFINSVLNQLNWVFSEFIGMLQELQNAYSRKERVLISSQQLKICAVCFDLTLALLRVLEMVACLAFPLFVRHDLPSSFLLSRLFQLLCQVLNRASSQDGCFFHIIALEIPGLENVDYLPILTSVCGILLGVLKEDINNYNGTSNLAVPNVTRTLLVEPSFQISSFNFLFEDDAHIYSLKFYKDFVSPEEMSLIEKMLAVINQYHCILADSGMATNAIDENDVCTICFAGRNSATFEPCNHHSCQACITHHLMNSNYCFFCKTIVTKVLDSDGKIMFCSQQEVSSSDTSLS